MTLTKANDVPTLAGPLCAIATTEQPVLRFPHRVVHGLDSQSRRLTSRDPLASTPEFLATSQASADLVKALILSSEGAYQGHSEVLRSVHRPDLDLHLGDALR